MSTEMIHARIDSQLKHEVETVFHSLGINTSDAIRMFLTQVILKKGIPFEIKIPNKETRKAIKEVDTNKNLKSYSQKEFHDLLNAS